MYLIGPAITADFEPEPATIREPEPMPEPQFSPEPGPTTFDQMYEPATMTVTEGILVDYEGMDWSPVFQLRWM